MDDKVIELAYRAARNWLSDSEPDSAKVIALMCHIELAINDAIRDSEKTIDHLKESIAITDRNTRAMQEEIDCLRRRIADLENIADHDAGWRKYQTDGLVVHGTVTTCENCADNAAKASAVLEDAAHWRK